jgi:hypothetical protein
MKDVIRTDKEYYDKGRCDKCPEFSICTLPKNIKGKKEEPQMNKYRITIDVEMEPADYEDTDVSDMLEGAWIYDEDFRGVVLSTAIQQIGGKKK